jgi:hypothetical protein
MSRAGHEKRDAAAVMKNKTVSLTSRRMGEAVVEVSQSAYKRGRTVAGLQFLSLGPIPRYRNRSRKLA